jgi:hypothetical protein
MPVHIPRDQEMTPGLFGILDAHQLDVVNEYWPTVLKPILDREEDLYAISIGHYFLHKNGYRFTKRASSDIYPEQYRYITNKPRLDDIEAPALKYIAMAYWDVLVEAWNGTWPPRNDAIRLWVKKKEPEIKMKCKQLNEFFLREGS